MHKKIIEEVSIENPIGNLYRKNHVLVLIADESGNFILGKKKNFYPDHIGRMIGGGIDEGEDSSVAARREVIEELDVELPQENFKRLCEVKTKAETNEGYMEMDTHVYSVQIPNSDLEKTKAGDDITEVVSYTLDEYKNLIEEMNKLDTRFVTEKFSFSWADWAKIYAPIHKYALEEYQK